MFERSLGTGQIAAMLLRAGIDWDQVTDAALLDGGTFNSVYRVALADGSGLILKAAPPPEMPVLRHEHGLLRTETLLYTLAAERGVAGVPAVVHDGGEFLLMTELPGQPRIGGLIDAERAFWGDPLADFVSLALLADIRKDRAFLDGYRQAGGPVILDARSEVRLALYRSYLYLIMLAEVAPRSFTPAERGRREAGVVPALAAELGILRDRRAG